MVGSDSVEQAFVDGSARPLPRFSLALVCLLHAVPLAWAAAVLPWRAASWFSLVVGTLALLHVVVATLALARRQRALASVWQVLAVYSLVVLAGFTWMTVSSALYLVELYRGVGRAVAAGLFGMWGLAALFTLPVSCWGLAVTVRAPLSAKLRRTLGAGGAVLLTVAIAAAWFVAGRARQRPVAALAAGGSAQFERLLRESNGTRPAEKNERRHASLFHERAVVCARPLGGGHLTLLVTALDGDLRATALCVQAETPSSLVRRLQGELASRGLSADQAVLDLVTSARSMARLHPLLDALALRPVHDGVCGENKCLAPWQLVALDAFTQHRPLVALPTASVGVSWQWLASSLGVGASAPLLAITTTSYLLEGGALSRLEGFRPDARAVEASALRSAVSLTERHIVAAQQKSGAFRYTLDPFSGERDVAKVSLPRQAGTTLVLCELGQSSRAAKVVRRALEQLASYEQRHGELSTLTDSPPRAKLGSTALPLVALVSCRERLGDRFDELIARLTRALLHLQRPDGSFHPELDLETGQATGAYEPMFATGQVILALVLVEQLAGQGRVDGLPASPVLHDAVARAMDYYAVRYWPSALRDLFFLEENWHCLAARAALRSHRHDGYERFCIDYVAFKSRLILTGPESARVGQQGGYSFSNMLPPHNTTTSGFGEALAAAVEVMRARDLDTREQEALMRHVLGFLLRQQWTAKSCFACASGQATVGGFSESAASPLIRIDYVQHAMAALGHGARALRLE